MNIENKPTYYDGSCSLLLQLTSPNNNKEIMIKPDRKSMLSFPCFPYFEEAKAASVLED